MAPASEPWLSDSTTRKILALTRYLSPALLLVVFLAVFVARSIIVAKQAGDIRAKSKQAGLGGKDISRPSSPSSASYPKSVYLDFSPGRKAFFILTNILLLLTFVGNAAIVIVHAILHRERNYWCGQAYVIYVLATFFVYCLVFISLVDTRPSPNTLHAITWAVSLVLEIILLGASAALYSTVHREGKAFDPTGGRLLHGFSTWEIFEVVVDTSRIFLLSLLLLFYSLFIFLRHLQIRARTRGENGSTDERTGLLKAHSTSNGYTQTDSDDDTEARHEEQAGWVRPDKLPSVTWWQYITNYSLFFKYIWPSKSRELKATFSVCVLLLLAGRGVNVLVPYQAGKVTDLLATRNGSNPNIPWSAISIFILYRLLQGGSGLINSLRQALWIPIGQYSYRELAVAIFEHVHTLSLDFHVSKKTGEVISAMNKGGSINTFLDQITFQVAPMLVDLCVAIVYFVYAFDIYYALIVALISLAYMYLTIRLAQWRADVKRQVTNLDRIEEAVKTDSIGLYETVKYFNAEHFENARYREVVNQYQEKEYILNASLCLMNVSQNLCFTIGLMAACFLAAFQISIGQRQVGKFVALLTYMAQLQQPLNFFGTFYRSIQSAMINSERILELFKEEPTVFDKPTATKLTSCKGKLRFRNVKFAYDPRRPALTGLDFECQPGTRTALVGASGVGKSTVFRLLFRFYNPGEGAIEVDDRNVEDITIDTLRSHIGVVPQETPLFNESIMYNLKYARQESSDEEVFEACRSASIHDKIMEFPDGYDSKVGDRGVKLSGGEKQRIAIARTILKNPRILLLDEATAALDSETEAKIQESIMMISEGRTSLVIAHRLSTIINADQIVVMFEGKVVEKGTHDELLALDKRYAKMWKRHIKAERAETQALALKEKAEKLTRDTQGVEGESSANQSESEAEGRAAPKRVPKVSFLGMTRSDETEGRATPKQQGKSAAPKRIARPSSPERARLREHADGGLPKL